MIAIAAKYFEGLQNALTDIDLSSVNSDQLKDWHGEDLYNTKKIQGYLNEIETLLLGAPDREIIKGVIQTIYAGSKDLSDYIQLIERDLPDNCEYLDRLKVAFDIFIGGLRKINQEWKLGISGLTDGVQTIRKTKESTTPFAEYFLRHKESLPEICKTIFSPPNSPKYFAIMFSLLTQKKFMVLPVRKRKAIYIAWYDYIEKPRPTGDNFDNINRLLDSTANGLSFDENDIDYINYKFELEKVLKENLIPTN